MVDGFRDSKDASLFLLGYHCLPLEIIDLVGDNKEFEVWAYFEVLYPLWVFDSLRTLKIHHWFS